jgi:hypothetical protein
MLLGAAMQILRDDSSGRQLLEQWILDSDDKDVQFPPFWLGQGLRIL